MANEQTQTKEDICCTLNEIGFEKERINRALRVYEHNYPIYDVSIIREILYRLTIKDQLTEWQKSNKTKFSSRIQVKKALKTFEVHDYYIEAALKQYEKLWTSANGKLIYDLQRIIYIVLESRAARTPKQKTNSCNLTIADIEMYSAATPTPTPQTEPVMSPGEILTVMSPEGGHNETHIIRFPHKHVAKIPHYADKIENNKQTQIVKTRRNKKDKLRLYNIEREIITTEKNYLDGLNILLHQLIVPIFEREYVEKRYYATIVSTIPMLIEFHTEFLTELNTAYNSKHKSLSNVFNRYILKNQKEFINIYAKYVSDYDEILDIFGSYMSGGNKSKLLNAYLSQMRKENKSLFNYLILPIQRIPRYILLLKDLKKYTNDENMDYENIENAIIIITQIADTINAKQKHIENLRKCIEIQESLHGLKHPIVDQSNMRIFEDKFTFIEEDHNHERIFYVFTDIVIVSNSKNKVKYVLDIRTIDIKMDTNVNVNDEKSNEFVQFTLITGITKPIVLFSNNIQNVNKIQNLIEVNRHNIWRQDLLQHNQE